MIGLNLRKGQQQLQIAMSKKASQSRYISDEEDYEYEPTKQKKEKPPRFIKNAIENVDPNEIVVNLVKTHYDIIEIVVEELGWVVERSKKSQKWDIMWTDYHIEAQDLFKLNDHQKISHFPAIEVLSRKNFLGRSLMKMSKLFPDDYHFFPPTWSIPSELGQLMRFDSQNAQEDKLIYIFKPQSGCQGKGISLLSCVQQIEGKVGIVQTYINSPFLIDGLKFDMRLYVLIYGSDPTRIYVYEEGLARFATEPYQKAKKKNLRENYIHLTNYAINKNNKKFIFNTSDKAMHVGHKRSLTSIFNLLKNRGVDVCEIKSKIDKLIVKTLLVGKPMLNHLYGLSQTDNIANDHCFHILGFDVILDEHLEPFLLQVNHTPSFATDTPLDKSIKKWLIKETLLLLNVNVETKKARIQKKKELEEKRAMRKLVKLSAQERTEQKKQVQMEKDLHEQATLKRYRKLYPLETSQYEQFEEFAQKIFNQQSGLKSKQKQIGSPLKNQAKLRPNSLHQISASSKVVKKIAPKNNSSIVVQETQVQTQRLPDITLKKGVSQSQASPPHRILKNYEFNPEAIFSQYKDRVDFHKIYIKQRIIDFQQKLSPQQTIIIEKEKTKREGFSMEPKAGCLKQTLLRSPLMFDDSSIQPSSSKTAKPTHKNFVDFASLSNRQKNSNIIMNEKCPVVLVRKDSRKKWVSGRFPSRALKGDYPAQTNQLQSEGFLVLKSMTFTKPTLYP